MTEIITSISVTLTVENLLQGHWDIQLSGTKSTIVQITPSPNNDKTLAQINPTKLYLFSDKMER